MRLYETPDKKYCCQFILNMIGGIEQAISGIGFHLINLWNIEVSFNIISINILTIMNYTLNELYIWKEIIGDKLFLNMSSTYIS